MSLFQFSLPHRLNNSPYSPARSISTLFLIQGNNRVVVSESIVRVVLSLESAQFLQTPRLVAIHGLKRLVAKGVVQVCCGQTLRLASIPQITSLLCPLLRKVFKARVCLGGAVEGPIQMICISIVIVWSVLYEI